MYSIGSHDRPHARVKGLPQTHAQTHVDAAGKSCGADHGLRLRCPKVTQDDGESEGGEGLGLRGD